MISQISKAAIPVAILFSLAGKPAMAADSRLVDACVDRNDVAVNFIVTRALMPRSANEPGLAGSDIGDKLSTIVLSSGGAYAEIRSDGQQIDTTRAQLTTLCSANPDLHLMNELMEEIMRWLQPPESLIDIENTNALDMRERRKSFQRGGAAGIPNFIDKPLRRPKGP